MSKLRGRLKRLKGRGTRSGKKERGDRLGSIGRWDCDPRGLSTDRRVSHSYTFNPSRGDSAICPESDVLFVESFVARNLFLRDYVPVTCFRIYEIPMLPSQRPTLSIKNRPNSISVSGLIEIFQITLMEPTEEQGVTVEARGRETCPPETGRWKLEDSSSSILFDGMGPEVAGPGGAKGRGFEGRREHGLWLYWSSKAISYFSETSASLRSIIRWLRPGETFILCFDSRRVLPVTFTTRTKLWTWNLLRPMSRC